MDNFIYAHYFPLSSQGNIYSMTILPTFNAYNKLLIASLRREIICFEYAESLLDLIPTTKEILFTYIPNGAEIISIDAFNKSSSKSDIVIGITIIKTDSKETFLNIYTGEENIDFNIDNISQNCFMIDLDYVPYQLLHVEVPAHGDDAANDNFIQNVFLLPGSDCKVHMYRESIENNIYKEFELEDSFPELLDLPSIIIWLDIQYFNSKRRRLTAFGCESGLVRVSLVDLQTLKVMDVWEMQFVNMISMVRLFTVETATNVTSDDTPVINMLVVNTTLPSVVFSDVLQNNLSKRVILPKSNFQNVQSTACIADIDLDGRNEILIGTYGQEMLVYKFQNKRWKLVEQRSFASPIYSIKHVDVTCDGVRELVVLTMKGAHILQHKPEHVERILTERLNSLTL